MEFPLEGGRGAHELAEPETRLRGAGARGARTARASPARQCQAWARTVALSRRGAAVASWSEKFWKTSVRTWAGARARVTQSRRRRRRRSAKRGLAGQAGAHLCVGDGRVARMPALECHLDPLALHNRLVDRRREPRRRRAPRGLERLEQKVCAAQRNLLGADCAHDLRHKTERKPEVERRKGVAGHGPGPRVHLCGAVEQRGVPDVLGRHALAPRALEGHGVVPPPADERDREFLALGVLVRQ